MPSRSVPTSIRTIHFDASPTSRPMTIAATIEGMMNAPKIAAVA